MAELSQNVPFDIATLYFEKPGKVSLREEPTPPLKPGEFFVETLYSGISTGTALTWFNGTNIKSIQGLDKDLRIFRGDIEPDIIDVYPKKEGFMEVGKVSVSKNKKVRPGTMMAMLYGPKTGHVANEKSFYVPLPATLDPLLGIFVAKLGPISLNGILYAADEIQRKPVKRLQGTLKGQRVVVFGAGMIGIFCGMFAKWAGASDVVIVDAIPERLAAAKKVGLAPMEADIKLPLDLKRRWKDEDPKKAGADFAFQCTGSDFLLGQAFSSLRVQGTVIDLGFYQQNASQVFHGNEFHHNDLRHICAQIGFVPEHQKGWNRKRLSETTIEFLEDYGEIIKEHLITHEFGFADAQEAFDRLSKRDNSMLQVVLNPKLLLREHLNQADSSISMASAADQEKV